MSTPTQELDESDLARQAVHDVEAFAELYRRNLNRVYRYHMAHVGHAKDAEDLTSQTFMAALEGIRSFRGTGSFAAWILGIASKKRLMFFRSSRPVWHFKGRYTDGTAFDILIQALEEQYLLPELAPGVTPG